MSQRRRSFLFSMLASLTSTGLCCLLSLPAMAQIPVGGKVVWESDDQTLYQYEEVEKKWVLIKKEDGRTERVEVGSSKTITLKDRKTKSGGIELGATIIPKAGAADLNGLQSPTRVNFDGYTCPDISYWSIEFSSNFFPEVYFVETLGMSGHFSGWYDHATNEGYFSETIYGYDHDDPIWIGEDGTPAYLDDFYYEVSVNLSADDVIQWDPATGQYHMESKTYFYSDNFKWEDGSPFEMTVIVDATVGDQDPPCQEGDGFLATAKLKAQRESETTLSFRLSQPGQVRVVLNDAHGREVRALEYRAGEAGTHHVDWDGKDTLGHEMEPGLYFAHLIVNDKLLSSKKMVFLR